MSSRIREHIRSNIVGYIALFLVLTAGTAYALPGSNTVFSDDIVNGQVQAVDLSPSSVGTTRLIDGGVATADLRAGAVTSAKIADGQVQAADIAANAVGGSQLAPDSVGATELETLHQASSTVSVAENTTGTATATCPSFAPRVISGGFSAGDDSVQVYASHSTADGWTVSALNQHGVGTNGPINLTAFAYCLEL